MDDAEAYWKMLEQAASGSVKSDALLQSFLDQEAKRKVIKKPKHVEEGNRFALVAVVAKIEVG